MKYIFITVLLSYLMFAFYTKQNQKQNHFILAFAQSKYIEKNGKNDNETNKTNSTTYKEKSTANFIGIFPKNNDTITIYKFSENLQEKPEKFCFWSKKNDDQSVIFYCAEQDDIKVNFSNQNNIIINNDIYIVNKEYYSFLKQKILIEKSVLDLTFFLKEGYGDYAESLEPLNRNWRNQKDDNRFKIISAKIKNKNFQTDDQFFNYNFTYKYRKNGMLENISGENSFNKKFIKENIKYIVYTIDRSINERASDREYLFKNKKTLFDSIVGNRVRNSNAATYYYKKYQSKLKLVNVGVKPKKIDEMLKILGVNKKNLR